MKVKIKPVHCLDPKWEFFWTFGRWMMKERMEDRKVVGGCMELHCWVDGSWMEGE